MISGAIKLNVRSISNIHLINRLRFFGTCFLLICAFSGTDAHAQSKTPTATPFPIVPSAYVNELNREYQEQLTALKDPNSAVSKQINGATKDLSRYQGVITSQLKKISDPAQAATLMKQSGVGGVDIMALAEQHAQFVTAPAVINTVLATYPMMRNVIDSKQCQESFWPGNTFCGSCISHGPFGICLAYGLTPATAYSWPTQATTVASGADSSPLSLNLVRDVARDLAGRVIESMPGVGSLNTNLFKNIDQAFKNIQFKQDCVMAMMKKEALKTATMAVVSHGKTPISANPVSIATELSACIKGAHINFGLIPSSQTLTAARQNGKLSNDAFTSLQRALGSNVAGQTGSIKTYSYSHSPLVALRMLAQQMEKNNVTYPNLRITFSISGNIAIKVANDPVLIHYNKAPYAAPNATSLKHLPELFLGAGGLLPNSSGLVAQNDSDAASAKVMLASSAGFNSASDVGVGLPSMEQIIQEKMQLQYLAANPTSPLPITPDPGFNPLKVVDLGPTLPTIKQPFNPASEMSLVTLLMNPKRAPEMSQFLKILKSPDICQNEGKLANAMLQSGAYNSAEMRNGIKYFKNLTGVLGIIKFGGGSSAINKYVSSLQGQFSEQKLSTSIDRLNLCSRISKVSLKTVPGTVSSTQPTSVATKTLISDIAPVAGYTSLIAAQTPPRDGVGGFFSASARSSKAKFTVNINTSENFYENKFYPALVKNALTGKTENPTPGNRADTVQYTGFDLEKLAAGKFTYDKGCRGPDINPLTAKDEALVLPGSQAKIYVHNTAFAWCPAYSPIDRSATMNGIPIGLILDLILRTIPTPGGQHRSLEKFTQRWY